MNSESAIDTSSARNTALTSVERALRTESVMSTALRVVSSVDPFRPTGAAALMTGVPSRRIAQLDLRQTLFSRSGEFRPGIRPCFGGFDIIGDRIGTDDGVDRPVEHAREIFLPWLVHRIIECERGCIERETVGPQPPFGIEHAQPHPLLLADLDQQRLLPFACSPPPALRR